jgi:hypothetical protein
LVDKRKSEEYHTLIHISPELGDQLALSSILVLVRVLGWLSSYSPLSIMSIIESKLQGQVRLKLSKAKPSEDRSKTTVSTFRYPFLL